MTFLSEIKKIDGVEFFENEPLDIHSTMRVGGTASLAAFPLSAKALCELLDYVTKKEIKHFVAGNASNTVFPDGNYDGVVIFTKKMKNISAGGTSITAECGVNLIYLSEFAKEKSLCGAEFLCGIPGTVGGAVYMNAGAHGHSVSEIVSSSKLYLPEKGCELNNRPQTVTILRRGRYFLSSVKLGILLFFMRSNNFVNDPVLQRFLCRHRIIPFTVPLHFFKRLPCRLANDSV